jgi:hypothetical protein
MAGIKTPRVSVAEVAAAAVRRLPLIQMVVAVENLRFWAILFLIIPVVEAEGTATVMVGH